MKFATIRTILTAALCGTTLLALSGCVSRDKTDLENYASDILSRPGGRIDPLPPIKPYERYLYKAGNDGLRDPFESFFQKKRDSEIVDRPDDPNQIRWNTEVQTHNREELEQSELDALRMVGILEDNDELWGIIRANDGTVHRVQVGNYMGVNFGKILNIQEDRIDLREIVKDSQGRWEERQATLALSEE
jgi:type IV pilus assembly protein PilP